MIACPSCNKQVARNARACPACGAQIRNRYVGRLVILAAVVFFVVTMMRVGGCLPS